jgi:hypothetical protein
MATTYQLDEAPRSLQETQMSMPGRIAAPSAARSPELWLGAALIAAGLLGHVLAARAIGGGEVAFRDHLLGFVLILVVTGGLIAVLTRRFWPGRTDRAWLVTGIVQALFGLYVWIERFHMAGH